MIGKFFIVIVFSLIVIASLCLLSSLGDHTSGAVLVTEDEPTMDFVVPSMPSSFDGSWLAPVSFGDVLVLTAPAEEIVLEVRYYNSAPEMIREMVWLPQVVVVETPPVEVEKIVEVVKTTSVAVAPTDTVLMTHNGQQTLGSMVVQRHKAPFVVFQELTDGGVGKKVIVEFVHSGEAVTYATGVSVVSFHDPRTGEVVSTRNFGPEFSVSSKFYEDFDPRFKNILKH